MTSKYRIRKLGQALHNGSARINGKVTDGSHWPEGTHYWIVDDLNEHHTYHVLVADRPSWARYAPKN